MIKTNIMTMTTKRWKVFGECFEDEGFIEVLSVERLMINTL